MREFKLINARGEPWSLNQDKSFFYDPNGLGLEHDVSYEQIGSTFVKLEDSLKQKSISGNILFKGYEVYKDFYMFIQHKPLVLEYTAAETVSIEISIDVLKKSELVTGGLLCDVSIKGLSTFYKSIKTENTASKTIGKIYKYAYPYEYADYASGSVEIESDSVIDSPAKLTIMGPCTNPSWTHYLNGTIAANGKVTCTIQDGNRLVVDATRVPYQIAEYNSKGEFVQDLYQKSDFNTQRYVFMGFGQNRISFQHEGDTTITLVAEGRILYETL